MGTLKHKRAADGRARADLHLFLSRKHSPGNSWLVLSRCSDRRSALALPSEAVICLQMRTTKLAPRLNVP